MIEEVIENKRLELVAEIIKLTETSKIDWNAGHDKDDYEAMVSNQIIEIKPQSGPNRERMMRLTISRNGPLRNIIESFDDEDFSPMNQNASNELARLYSLAKLKAEKVEENLDYILSELRGL